MNDDRMRNFVRVIKRRFLGWRIPPVELPPDSVIEEAINEIFLDDLTADAIVRALAALPERVRRFTDVGLCVFCYSVECAPDCLYARSVEYAKETR